LGAFHVAIPARAGSSRLPGKALADLGGKPMLQWVYEKACAAGAADVSIATDDERIAAAARAFGAVARLTSACMPPGPTGSRSWPRSRVGRIPISS